MMTLRTKNHKSESKNGLAGKTSRSAARAKLQALIDEQGIKPISDLDDLMSKAEGIWPEEETADQFIAWRKKRREESRVK